MHRFNAVIRSRDTTVKIAEIEFSAEHAPEARGWLRCYIECVLKPANPSLAGEVLTYSMNQTLVHGGTIGVPE